MNPPIKSDDVSPPNNPDCPGCGNNYSPLGSLNFEYSKGEREIDFPIRLQPYERLSGKARVPIPIDPVTGNPQEGVHEFDIKSVMIDQSGILVCTTCIGDKPRDRLIEDLYTYMKDYWTADRLPDLEELMLTASTSLN